MITWWKSIIILDKVNTPTLILFGSILNSCFFQWPKQGCLGHFPKLALLTCWKISMWLVNLSSHDLQHIRNQRETSKGCWQEGMDVIEKTSLKRKKKVFFMVMDLEKLHILAWLTSSLLTLPSLTCFSRSFSPSTPVETICWHVPNMEAAGTAECLCLPYRLHYNLFKIWTIWVGSWTEDGLDHILLIAVFSFHKGKQYGHIPF